MKYLKWKQWYSIVQELYKETGSINVSAKYVYKDVKIGDWISRQRGLYRRGNLSSEQVSLLEDVGIIWEGRDAISKKRDAEFLEKVELLRRYKTENGNTRVPNHYWVSGVDLGKWASNIRRMLRDESVCTLTDEHKKILSDLGFEIDWYQEVLSIKWKTKYEHLKEYIQVNPGVLVNENTEYRGEKIGSWLKTQKTAYRSGKLEKNRAELLQELGVDLMPDDSSWDEKYEIAKRFYQEFHHLDIPLSMIIDGVKIGSWLSNQRQAHNGTRKDMTLSDDQIERLEAIGINWNVSNMGGTSFAEQALFFYLRQLFPDVENHFTEFGFELDLYIPSQKIAFEYDGEYWHRNKYDADNEKDNRCKDLGIRLVRIRERGLADTESAICYKRDGKEDNKTLGDVYSKIIRDVFHQEIDIDIDRDALRITKDFNRFATSSWYAFYREAKNYYIREGNLLVPHSYISENGKKLGAWIANQRHVYKDNNRGSRITENEIRLLNDIGMVWDVRDTAWEENYRIAEQYYLEHGNLLVERSCIYKGINLGKWINTQRNDYHQNQRGHYRNPMPLNRIQKLEKIGMVWRAPPSGERKWNDNYAIAHQYYDEYGCLQIPKRMEYQGFKLGEWVIYQRSQYRRGKLTADRIEKLEKIGMVWGEQK